MNDLSFTTKDTSLSWCSECEDWIETQDGICGNCERTIDASLFWKNYPDAPDTDWRPWMTEPEEESPRVIVWDFTR